MTDLLHTVNEDLLIVPKIPEGLNLPRKNVVPCEMGREFLGEI